MEEAKALIRTAVRSFYTDPKQILLTDTLMQHGVLHLDDFTTLTGFQAKELRSVLQPLRASRLISTHPRREVHKSTQREATREYYWCVFSDAVNVVKYRLAKLRQQVSNEYLSSAGPDFWVCKNCEASWKEMDIVPNAQMEMRCLRCNAELEINDAAMRDKDSHEGIMKLNSQLERFNSLIARVDAKLAAGQFHEASFDDAFKNRRVVPGGKQHMWEEAKRGRERDKAAGAVNENDVDINITSEAVLAKEEAEREAIRKAKLRENATKPDWITGGVTKTAGMDVRAEDGEDSTATEANLRTDTLLKNEDEDEKKADLKGGKEQSAQERADQALMEQYMLDMQREQEEAERRQREEDEEEDDDDDFEDVPGTGTGAVGTPASSTQEIRRPPVSAVNGIKREFEDDSSEAATPASEERDSKRPKTEGSTPSSSQVRLDSTANGDPAGASRDDDSEEEEFEDV
jgi:transcription initiation factor TFIIE subunit alpha